MWPRSPQLADLFLQRLDFGLGNASIAYHLRSAAHAANNTQPRTKELTLIY
jgi:hypothetical protein